MSTSIEITPELMAGFLDEAPEYLDMLDVGLMELESQAGSGVLSLEAPEDREQMNTMFRAAHSLKGLAAAFGFTKIKDLTHSMETLFDQVRMRKRDLTKESFETLFSVFDRLKVLVKELSEPTDAPIEIEDVVAALDRILKCEPVAAIPAPPASSEPATEPVPLVPIEAPPAIAANLQRAAVSTSKKEENADACLAEALQSEVFRDPELRALFIETSIEAVDELNQGLLGLEESPADKDRLNRVFRAAHNLKGASGAAGLKGLNGLTHEMETVLDHLRNGRLQLNDEMSNALFATVDQLRAVVEQIRDGQVTDIQSGSTGITFERWVSKVEVTQIPPVSAASNTDQGMSAAEAAWSGDETSALPPISDGGSQYSGGEPIIQVRVTFSPGFDEAAIQAYLIHNRLSDLGSVVSTHPDLEQVQGDTALTEVVYCVQTAIEPAELEQVVRSYNVQSVAASLQNTNSVPRRPTTEAPSASEASAVSSPSAAGPVAPKAETMTQAAKPSFGDRQSPASASTSAASGPEVTKSKSATARAATATQSAKRTPASAAATGSGATKATKDAPAPAKSEAAPVKSGETLRVDQERLDQLMNLGGELVINRARFVQIHRRFRDVFDGKNLGYLVEDINDRLAKLAGYFEAESQPQSVRHDVFNATAELSQMRQSFQSVRSLVERVHDLRTSMYDFDEALHGLTRVSDGIQKGIMGTRMVPIGPLFTRFKRVVRDLCKSTGKQVELVLKGEATELDKRMIDELGDPLTHMVRNSIDHGIETPDVRIAAGKNPTGTLILEACHRGNSICIDVRDDGGGISIERVKAKAVEKGLATEAQVSQMSEREIAQFIMQPGFSTAQVVTDLSGRGMGMDIVKSKIEKLNGIVELDSKSGQGTQVVIRLPLTLAILTSMVSRIGKGVYAIPLEAVAEIITVQRSAIQRIQRRRVVQVRERIVPLVTFEEIFETDQEDLQTRTRDGEELAVVIIGFENERVGLAVDELLGQEDVVIKSIAENYRHVRGFAGASIRGDGTVSLILDVGAVMELSTKAASRASAPALAAV